MSGRRAKRERAAVTKLAMSRIFRVFWLRLRAILRRRAPSLPADAPSPCTSCAFNPATDTWRGYDQTAYMLARAIEKEQPFYCHDNLPKDATGQWQPLPDRSQMKLCAGYAAIKNDPETRRAFQDAVMATGAGRHDP